MAKWLPAALDYIAQWAAYKVRLHEFSGVSIAVLQDGKPVLATALGQADMAAGVRLTPDHQFRVASHSKTFTTVGVMKLVEAGRLRLDDRVGQHVKGLHKALGRATIGQLLSHSAGVIRDGADGGQWADRRPFLDADELRAELAVAPVLPANTRMKYSNHGFGLAGLAIEAVTGERYGDWMLREVVAKAGLKHTWPDTPTPEMDRLAKGHGTKLLLGQRAIIPGDNPTNALAPATGFVSTATELAKFFSQIDPDAKKSLLHVESRREMTRPHWRVPDLSVEQHYGLGTIQGRIGSWETVGHSGGFQGFLTQTAVLRGQGLTVSVLTNGMDGVPGFFLDGIVRILQAFAGAGSPSKKLADWSGRWWGGPWGALDLVPLGDKVLVASPGLWNPFADAAELAIGKGDEATIAKASGFASHGEAARLVRSKSGKVSEIWLAASRLQTEKAAAKEVRALYQLAG